MAIYVMLSTLTDEGCNTLKRNPERIKEVNSEVQAMGGRIISQYALLGGFDFITLLEAEDNETAAKISINLCSRGTVKIQTLPAFEIDGFVKSLK